METLQDIADYITNSEGVLKQFSYNSDFYGFFFGVDLFILIIHILFLLKCWKGNTRNLSIVFILFLTSKVCVYYTYIGISETSDRMIDGVNILWGISMLSTTILSSFIPFMINKLETSCKNTSEK